MANKNEPTTRAGRQAFREQRRLEREAAQSNAQQNPHKMEEDTKPMNAMTNLTVERTPVVIAAEIRSLQDQARRMVTYHAVEIGRRLIEAKALVNHGSWGDWLTENVNYSQRTAQNLIRLAEEYGGAAGLLGETSIPQAFADLDTTKALALLSLPPEQREAFLEENDVKSMSTRELQAAIKERDEARAEAADLEARRAKDKELLEAFESGEKQLRAQITDLNTSMEAMRQNSINECNRLTKEIEAAKKNNAAEKQLKELQGKLADAEKQVKELNTELEEQKAAAEPTVVETVPEDVKNELEELRATKQRLEIKLGQAAPAAIKFRLHCETITQTYKLLLGDLAELKSGDQDTYTRCRNAAIGMIDTMRGSL